MNKVIAFILGAAAGSLLTWKLVEKKYRDLAEEEIESVREYYIGKDEHDKFIKNIEVGPDPNIKIEEVRLTKEDIKGTPEYDKMLDDLGYTNEEMERLLDDPDVSIEKTDDGFEVYIEPGEEHIEPYIISPEEFGELEGHDRRNWTYYSDFVLTNELGDIVSNPESYIGDALSHFGDFEDDAVHVRNENIECDYEIIKVEESFTEINGGDM